MADLEFLFDAPFFYISNTGASWFSMLWQYSVTKSFNSSMEPYSGSQSHSVGTLHWMANCLHLLQFEIPIALLSASILLSVAGRVNV